MTGKLIYVVDENGLSLLGGCATNSFADGDAHTSGFALKRTKYELVAFVEIETGPVKVRKRIKEQRSKVGGVGNEVTLTLEQASQL